MTVAVLITSIIAIFFIILSIPLNLLSSNTIGSSNTSIIMAATYLILASIIFLVVYRGINKMGI
ncbi:hypothetical protein [Sulfolobus acidocaldarius]|uniref:Uncharacterized protein n=3 Tax=Sulfolobus acidocaldarius TaxID=2285 RepID=Q4J752_SULAC|nr:hypothetical protein [Sulfolobus acidocaldarius]AAY81379.1 hypothetical protein Saci_2085 [Sulfolobus acidocaldarius DSM 639]